MYLCKFSTLNSVQLTPNYKLLFSTKRSEGVRGAVSTTATQSGEYKSYTVFSRTSCSQKPHAYHMHMAFLPYICCSHHCKCRWCSRSHDQNGSFPIQHTNYCYFTVPDLHKFSDLSFFCPTASLAIFIKIH